ncbi:MAG: homoserine dehydrogenase [Ruminococcaceae bacterium]|nr:homoserine dehydrogenase [Oscillospiraceae bacterium]
MAKIAVLGYGVVGSGTVEVIYKNQQGLEKKAGQGIEVKYILDLRDFPDSPYADKFTKDFNVIVNDPEIDVVVEVLGGVKFAYPYVKASLEAGKSVVTSNKELVATYGAELLAIAKEKNINFFFEASVGGGIPIIRPLHQCLSANRIEEIAGILNGTTNFILTKMIRDNMGFDEALKIAQELGYAERDPSADVDGIDACRKICILASLSFGKHVYPDNIHTEGITKITPEDVAYCENFGGSIKLIGWAAKQENDKVAIMVCPAFIHEDSQLAGVNDVFNAILVRGDSTGDVVFYGKGAGKLPTASAVVADVVDVVKATGTSKSLRWEDSEQDFIEDTNNIVCENYIRVSGTDKSLIEYLFGEVTYLSRKGAPADELAFTTSAISEKECEEKIGELQKKATVLGRIRILNY